jgi:predicted  nucleic acid-binding Zn-ribbon protein
VNEIEKLQNVQQYDTRTHDIERELRDIPARKQQEQERLAARRQALAEIQEQLKLKQAEVKKFDVEGGSLRDKIDKLRQQQLQLKTNKEFQAMEAEIKTLQDQISELEDRELLVMEEVDALQGQRRQREQELREEEQTVQADIRVLDERMSGLRTELEQVRADREKAAADVAAEWLSVYERLAVRKEQALVHLEEGGICGGCHMKLPPSAVHDTRKRTAIVTCAYCGRLLY